MHDQLIKRLAVVRKGKFGIVASRRTGQEVVEWAMVAIPKEHHVALVTALMMMQNTIIDITANYIEELVNPDQETIKSHHDGLSQGVPAQNLKH